MKAVSCEQSHLLNIIHRNGIWKAVFGYVPSSEVDLDNPPESIEIRRIEFNFIAPFIVTGAPFVGKPAWFLGRDLHSPEIVVSYGDPLDDFLQKLGSVGGYIVHLSPLTSAHERAEAVLRLLEEGGSNAVD